MNKTGPNYGSQCETSVLEFLLCKIFPAYLYQSRATANILIEFISIIFSFPCFLYVFGQAWYRTISFTRKDAAEAES